MPPVIVLVPRSNVADWDARGGVLAVNAPDIHGVEGSGAAAADVIWLVYQGDTTTKSADVGELEEGVWEGNIGVVRRDGLPVGQRLVACEREVSGPDSLVVGGGSGDWRSRRPLPRPRGRCRVRCA